jgi:hypothetical protein
MQALHGLVFLVNWVSCYYFMTLWTGEDCQGPPSVYSEWGSNQIVLPIYVWYNLIGVGYNKCGMAATPGVHPKSCCVTSLLRDNVNFTRKIEGYTSVSTATTDLLFANNFPAAGNGYSYCYLESTTPNELAPKGTFKFNLASLYKWIILVGANISTVSCLPGGIMRIDDKSYLMDSNTTEYFTLTSTTQTFSSSSLGNFRGKFITMTGATNTIQWSQYAPSILFTPTFVVIK